MGVNFKSLASDWLLPAAGAYLGYGLGGDYGLSGAAGAGIGAGAGRFAGGYIKNEDTDSQVKNSLFAGAAGYGAGSLYDKYYGYGGNFGSMGDATLSGGASSGGAAAAGGEGGSGFNWGGLKAPTAMAGISALANAYGASEAQKNAQNIYNQQLANWNNTAFPNAARVDAQTASAMSGINQQSMIARQRLMDSMAARGMGANSGVLAGAAAEEDRARRTRMAALANNLIQFRNTPMYAPPIYQGSPYTPGGAAASAVGTTAGIGAGLALQQNFGGGQSYQEKYYKRLLDNQG